MYFPANPSVLSFFGISANKGFFLCVNSRLFCYIVRADCISCGSHTSCQSFERIIEWRYGLAYF